MVVVDKLQQRSRVGGRLRRGRLRELVILGCFPQRGVGGRKEAGDKQKNKFFACLIPSVVHLTRLELAQPFGHYHLKVACIPISPQVHNHPLDIFILP